MGRCPRALGLRAVIERVVAFKQAVTSRRRVGQPSTGPSVPGRTRNRRTTSPLPALAPVGGTGLGNDLPENDVWLGFETYASESVEFGFERPALSMATA